MSHKGQAEEGDMPEEAHHTSACQDTRIRNLRQ